jgi:hypothetical protein
VLIPGSKAPLGALVAVLVALGLSACSGASSTTAGAADYRPVVHFDGPEYSSVQDLGQAADAVVVGTVTGVRARTAEPQPDGDASDDALPIALYELKLDRVLKGDPSAGPILVTRIDTTKVATTDHTPFEVGQQVVLFLRTAEWQWDGHVVHSVVGMDQGRLELVDGRLRATRTDETPPEQQLPGDGQTVDEIAAQLT